MTATWNTKYGSRRVRRDPPTLAEAIAAAQGLTSDREAQIELAAGLMGVTLLQARDEMKKLAPDRRAQLTMVTPTRDKAGARVVVVERKASRRIAAGAPPRAAGTSQRLR